MAGVGRSLAIWLLLGTVNLFVAGIFAFGLTTIFPSICGANALLPVSSTLLGPCTGGYLVAGGITFVIYNVSIILVAMRLSRGVKH